jgi:hypothetical protein
MPEYFSTVEVLPRERERDRDKEKIVRERESRGLWGKWWWNMGSF